MIEAHHAGRVICTATFFSFTLHFAMCVMRSGSRVSACRLLAFVSSVVEAHEEEPSLSLNPRQSFVALCRGYFCTDLYIICEGCISLSDVASQVRSLEATIYYGGSGSGPQHHRSQVSSHPAVWHLFFCCPFPFMSSCFFCPFSRFPRLRYLFPPTGRDLLSGSLVRQRVLRPACVSLCER